MIADWDWLVIVGAIVVICALYLIWGPGAAMLAVGVALILAGVGGASIRRGGKTSR